MGKETGISWTNHTFSPWWGCARVSPGCEHCYAETFAKRVGHSKGGSKLPLWGVDAERRPASAASWAELVKWNAKAKRDGVRRRVFVASMADVFEVAPERNASANLVMDAGRKRLWSAIEDAPRLDFQLLTKRPENVEALVPWGSDWPTNVWLGVTAEDQARADERIPALVGIPAKVRFLSCEPLLGSVDLSYWLECEMCRRCGTAQVPIMGDPTCSCLDDEETGESSSQFRPGMVDWVIVGGESGPGGRPFALEWARTVVEQCSAAGVACFVKQMGSRPTWMGGRVDLRDPKGGDPLEWPEALRVRQFPGGA